MTLRLALRILLPVVGPLLAAGAGLARASAPAPLSSSSGDIPRVSESAEKESASAGDDRTLAAPKALEGVDLRERLGSKISLDIPFTNGRGETTSLREFTRDGKPLLLTLNYYSCATLCSVQLNGLVQGLKGMDLVPGRDFHLVTLSIDPKNDASLAAAKRDAYLNALQVKDADWTFLVGGAENIATLARELGFHYRWDAETGQFAHPAAAYFIAGDGTISRYLYGVMYPPRDLTFALMETSAGRIGSLVDRVILRCFHYDDLTGQYTPFAMGMMRVGGAVTVSVIGLFLGFLFRRDRRLLSRGGRDA